MHRLSTTPLFLKTAQPSPAAHTIPALVKLCLLIDLGLGVAYWANILVFNYIQPPGISIQAPNSSSPALSFNYHCISNQFDLNKEQNLTTWYSSAQLLLVGMLLALLAYHEFNRRDPASWALALAPTLFLFLSLDEYAMFHEIIGVKVSTALHLYKSGGAFTRTGLWMVYLFPPFILACFLIARLTRKYWAAKPAIMRKYLLGLAVYLFAAGGIELIANKCTPDTLPDFTQICLEEVGEMLGVTLMLWATCDLLTHHRFQLLRHPAPRHPAA